MKFLTFTLITILFCEFVLQSLAFEYNWELDETPEGSESATVVEPIIVTLLDEPQQIPPHTAALQLLKKYSVFIDINWTEAEAYKLFQIFESIPQRHNSYNDPRPIHEREITPSIWRLTDQHLLNGIEIEHHNGIKIVTIAREAFVYATPIAAKIDGIRGRYFSKRLYRAVVRYVSDNGADRHALERILRDRYAVSTWIPDYAELTKDTTQEHAGRFQEFKNEELIAIASMFEEFPSGMHKTPGLKYLVRRLDGTPNPIKPEAIGIAWISAEYIEFMEGAFHRDSIHDLYRTILHEKAHFLWAYLFDDQLKQDWIKVGSWYKDPNVPDGWATTQETEFVSAYAHGANPDEDMAESISFYITNPDKLHSRAPAKYEFIQNRVMHGTRYISKIREDLTFQVYNLYPDYIYPGRIKSIDIRVEGAPEEDKQITIDIEIHTEGGLDTASGAYANIYSKKGTSTYMYFNPIGKNAGRLRESNILRGTLTLSKYAASGYWTPDAIGITDTVGNRRWQGIEDFGWRLYIDNPLADDEPPEYVKGSMRLSLSNATTKGGRVYQILTARWQVIEKNELYLVYAWVNDDNPETYSRTLRYSLNYGRAHGYIKDFTAPIGEVNASINIPDYFPSGEYRISYIEMRDTAGNSRGVYFTDPPEHGLHDTEQLVDELPSTIEIVTTNPDTAPPVLDVNNITIKAQPTQPEDPNGETIVDMTFRIKDDISGFWTGYGRLRDSLGGLHHFHIGGKRDKFDSGIYFIADPNESLTYEVRVLLPVGSPPGTWGLVEANVRDAAGNSENYDFTEILRFELIDETQYDLNADGDINILDLVIVANAIGESDSEADVNRDGIVNILDLVQVANHI
ncbi:hypothetical protein F4141_13640 [Candidatus Poribacteria bacterium]|nr:hypothetical protein [Candidatus Poribacteria bacterium]